MAVSPKAMRYLIILVVTLGSFTYGYCSSIIASTATQPSFRLYFALDTRSNSNAITGAINGLFQTGGLFGALSSCYAADTHGRRVALCVGSVFAVVGGALQAGSVQIVMYLIARFITGVGIGMLVTLVPLYQSECSPPKIRGLLVGTHGILLCCGYSAASWVGVGFFFVHASGAQWRLPLAIQCVAPLVLSIAVFFLPESPRWLIRQDHIEKAFIAFKTSRADENEDPEEMRQDFSLLCAQIRHEKEGDISLLDMFRRPNLRRRCLLGFYTMFLAQGSATLVITNYASIIYSSLGFSPINQLLIQSGYITVCPFGNAINALVVDKVGRTRMLMMGCAGVVTALAGESISVARFTETGSRSAAGAAVFFLFWHIACFSSTCDATSYIYASEIFPTPLRARGLSISVSGLFLSTIVYLSVAPTAFAHIGWKFYIFFIIITSISILVVWRFFPETKGKSLEEIAAIFGDTVEHEPLDDAKMDFAGEFSADEKGRVDHLEAKR